MIKKFEIFESTKWNKKRNPKYKIGDICMWSFNFYDAPYKYNEQECEVIGVPEEFIEDYLVRFDDDSEWLCKEDDLRLMTEEDMQNYTDNLGKIGKMYYWSWNPETGIPYVYVNTICELVNISEEGYVVRFLDEYGGRGRNKWFCDSKDLRTEDEMYEYFLKQDEIRKKYIDIDPYGEEDWEEEYESFNELDPYGEENWDEGKPKFKIGDKVNVIGFAILSIITDYVMRDDGYFWYDLDGKYMRREDMLEKK